MALRLALKTLLVVLAAAGAVNAMVLHERRTIIPSGFVRHGPAPPSHALELRFGLAPNDAAGLEAKLTDIATPGSARFRQWLSKEEVRVHMAPSAATVSAFMAFASAHGLNTTHISPNEDWVSATVSVATANKLFNATFELFSHPSLSGKIARTMSVSLPSEMVGVVNVIHPTTAFALPPATSRSVRPPMVQMDVRKGKSHVAASCNTSNSSGIITPQCLLDIYGIPASPATQANNSLTVTGYGFQWAQKANLKAFLQEMRPDMPLTTDFALQTLDGGDNPQGIFLGGGGGLEAELDMQYAIGVANGVPTAFLSVGGYDFLGALLDTANFVDGASTPPTVLSTSYGVDESSTDRSMASAICNTYMALSARGVSVIFASGDGGVRGGHDDPSQCDVNKFAATFPSGCPFVTSVGATQGFPEKSSNFTSGGFSDIFAAPGYQSAHVKSFLKTVPSDFKGTFNHRGRGFPDVSVQGVNFQIVQTGGTTFTGGTSAAAPTFAAMIALVNDRLLAAGKPVLGFLNPFLYAHPGVFSDITVGHNSGFVCPETSVAFDAARGWDPLTGLGTPNFHRLLRAAMDS